MAIHLNASGAKSCCQIVAIWNQKLAGGYSAIALSWVDGTTLNI
jgi:hypothetical protein